MPVVRPTADAFGTLLRQLLRATGTTQAALAAELGLSKWTVSRFVSGWRRPEPDLVIRIAAVLGTDPNPLLQLAGYLPAGYRVDEQVIPEPMMRLSRLLTPGWEERLAALEEGQDEPDPVVLMRVLFDGPDSEQARRLRVAG